MQVILPALKRYGMILVDNGSDFHMSGTPDAHWPDSKSNSLAQLHASDLRVTQMMGVIEP